MHFWTALAYSSGYMSSINAFRYLWWSVVWVGQSSDGLSALLGDRSLQPSVHEPFADKRPRRFVQWKFLGARVPSPSQSARSLKAGSFLLLDYQITNVNHAIKQAYSEHSSELKTCFWTAQLRLQPKQVLGHCYSTSRSVFICNGCKEQVDAGKTTLANFQMGLLNDRPRREDLTCLKESKNPETAWAKEQIYVIYIFWSDYTRLCRRKIMISSGSSNFIISLFQQLKDI